MRIVLRLKIIPPKKPHHLGSSSASPIAIPNYSATVLSIEKSSLPKPKRQRINPKPTSRVIQQAVPDSPPILPIQFKHKIDELKAPTNFASSRNNVGSGICDKVELPCEEEEEMRFGFCRVPCLIRSEHS
uniref:Uncharacterized protein n=1 Tax=Quercus lobata TaxID=97700 RepID=A0A7N2LN92_QUELO